MYGKLFQSMYDGTLVEDWRALITFQQMLVLSDADGTVDMTAATISRRTGIPLDLIEAGIKVLEADDPYSRTPDHHGKRIMRLDDHRDWGWFIVNHEKYKMLQSADTKREQARVRKRRQRQKEHETSQPVTQCHADSRMSRYTDTDTDTKTLSGPIGPDGDSKLPPCPHQAIVDLYHTTLPQCRTVREWNKTRRGYLQARWREKPERQNLDFWREFFTYVSLSDFLTGKTDGRNGSPPFVADLEWLIRPVNFVKVVEGKYHAESHA